MKVRSLLPGWIPSSDEEVSNDGDSTSKGDRNGTNITNDGNKGDRDEEDLLDWYRFVFNVNKHHRRLIKCDTIIEFFKVNFDIDLTIADINQRMYLFMYHTMKDDSPLPSNEDMKKIAFYDIKVTQRLNDIFGLSVFSLFNSHYINSTTGFNNLTLYRHLRTVIKDYKPDIEVNPLYLYKYHVGDTEDIEIHADVKYLSLLHYSNKIKLPKDIEDLSIETADNEFILPESLLSLMVRDTNKIIFNPPYKLERLYLNTYNGEILPTSLEFLSIHVISKKTDLSYLVNLKVCIIGKRENYYIKFPKSIEHLSLPSYDNNDDRDLPNLISLSVLYVKYLPKTVKYLQYRSNYRKVITTNILYLDVYDLDYIPWNLVYLNLNSPTTLNLTTLPNRLKVLCRNYIPIYVKESFRDTPRDILDNTP